MSRPGLIRRLAGRTLRGEPWGIEGYLWAAQRVTGLGLLGFLVWHLATLGSVFGGRAGYDQALAALDRPLVKVGELVLVWAALFHAANGLRLILLNLWSGVDHRRLGYLALAASLILGLTFIPFIFH